IAKGPIAQGALRTSLVLFVRLLVQAGALLLVARLLGSHEFGAFAAVAALAVLFGTMSTLGTHLVLLGQVSKDPRRSAEVLSYAVPTTVVCGSLLLIPYLVICFLAWHQAGIAFSVFIMIG